MEIGMKKAGAVESTPPRTTKATPNDHHKRFVRDELRSLTIDQLAPLIGKSVSSIRSDMSRHPERLPKWWKCPGGAKRPLWFVSTVECFIEEHAARCGVAATKAKG
jgi:hypothetical protein